MIVEIDDAEAKRAEGIATSRLEEQSRWHSRHRPTSRNLTSQLRGAIGEIAAVKWLRSEGLTVEAGFENDERDDSDLTVDGLRIEIMTAQIRHREITGFCVPPNKLWAARKRGAIGYLFIGTDGSPQPREALIQSGVKIDDVDADPPRETFINPKFPVVNFVIRESDLLSPGALVEMIRGRSVD